MIFLIFPHQLFEDVALLKGKRVLLVEEPLLFTQYIFHKQKLVAQRASMKFYEDFLRKSAIEVFYYEDDSYVREYKDAFVECYDVVDNYLEKRLRKDFANIKFFANPNFIAAQDSEKFLHKYYINRRKSLGILLDTDAKPLGGKWSFDAQNRKKLPKDVKAPPIMLFDNPYVREAKEYVSRFKSVGECEEFYYPTSFDEAKQTLEHFLQRKFASFGEYQDAMKQEESFLFHSNISSALNSGLISLPYVIDRVLRFEDVALNAKEGFIRQIIGWREFMLKIYKDDGARLRNDNFFNAQNSIPKSVLEARTGLVPLDDVMQKLHRTSYLHHIERLMILGNIFLLLEIKPNEVHDFFMRYFIDAYDWVMVGNVYAMALYADGGTYTTKPYMASSNYVLKMSDYKKGEWCESLDGLYWSFLDKHKEKFANNPRMKMQLSLLEKMDEAKLRAHKKAAKDFKDSIGLYDMQESDEDRLVEMAWQDRVPFDIIEQQYGLTENQVKKKMRSLISAKAYKRWRKRVHNRKTKHTAKLDHKPSRFQGPW